MRSGSPIVADRPIRWNSTPVSSLSRSKAKDSWTPLSSVASSWTSSTTTHLTERRCSFILFPIRIAWKVSGVVIITSGGLFAWRVLALIGVSPCRTWILMSRSFPISSSRRRRSLLRARSGVTYRTEIPRGFPSALLSMSLSSTGRMAASVLPVPVGAISSTFSPLRIAGMASSWIGLASRKPSFSSLCRTGGLRVENAEFRIYCTNSHLWDDLFFFFGLLLSFPWTFGCDIEEDQNESGKAEDVEQELEQRKLLVRW